MAKRRRTPPLEIPPRPVEITDATALRVLGSSCTRKHRYDDRSHARADAHRLRTNRGENVAAYQCPFGSITGGVHFHVGHTPAQEAVGRIAAAVRYFAQHPDRVPR